MNERLQSAWKGINEKKKEHFPFLSSQYVVFKREYVNIFYWIWFLILGFCTSGILEFVLLTIRSTTTKYPRCYMHLWCRFQIYLWASFQWLPLHQFYAIFSRFIGWFPMQRCTLYRLMIAITIWVTADLCHERGHLCPALAIWDGAD